MTIQRIDTLLAYSTSRHYDPVKLVNDIEKHLSDFRSGNGNLSKRTSYTLGDIAETNSSVLATLAPKSLRNYSAYLTALPYDSRARYVNGIRSGVESLPPLLVA